MRIRPAIDLMQGRAVQLEGGDPEKVLIEEVDPVQLAEGFAEQGADALHVVDLDRAMERGDNRDEIDDLLELDLDVQVAGGLRDDEAVDDVLDAGASRVVAGTKAIADPDWLARRCKERPDRLVAAIDVKGGEVVTHGWTESSGLALPEAVDRLVCDGLAAFLCTHVDREGLRRGVDPGPFRVLAHHSPVPVVAAGGISSLADLDLLADAGVEEVVVGTALYLDELDLAEAIAHVQS